MKVNIVMLVKDRDKLTKQALDTLSRNTPLDLYTLTIVDDCSRTPLVDWYEFRGESKHVGWKPMPHTVLRIERSKGITGQARNLGVYFSERYWGRNDYLYLSDSDVYFTPGWLQTLVDTIEDDRCKPVCKLIGGWNHQFLQPNWTSTPWADKNNIRVATHDAITGASQLMRWSTWDKYGPLDAHAQGVSQGEDWQFCQNIIKDGGRVGSVYPRVVFNCGVTNSFGKPATGQDVMLKELQEAKIKYPDLIWQ